MAEYYFDGTNGDNSNDGLSDTAPKKDIGSGLTVSGSCTFNIKRGTRVHITAEVYPTGAFVVQPYGSGTERAEVEIDIGAQLTNTGSGGSTSYLSGLSFFGPSTPINGLRIDDGAIYVDGVWFDGFNNCIQGGGGASGGGYVKNCIMTNIVNNGITLGNDSYAAPNVFIVENNYIDGTGTLNDCITYHDGDGTGGANGIIRNNVCIGANENGIDITVKYSNTLIYGNQCYNQGNQGIVSAGTGDIIRNNYIESSGYEGILANTGAVNLRIEGNLTYNCGKTTNACGFIVTTTAGHVDVLNNTFIAGPNSASSQIARIANGAEVDIYNNIFFIAGAANRYLVCLGDGTSINTKNNLYYGHLGVGASPFYINSTTGRTWTQWQAIATRDSATQDINSIYGSSPQLDANYRPLPTSPCIAAGKAVDLPILAYDGSPFRNPPSIGAHEYRQATNRAQDLTRAQR
jgi:hypothetical protein